MVVTSSAIFTCDFYLRRSTKIYHPSKSGWLGRTRNLLLVYPLLARIFLFLLILYQLSNKKKRQLHIKFSIFFLRLLLLFFLFVSVSEWVYSTVRAYFQTCVFQCTPSRCFIVISEKKMSVLFLLFVFFFYFSFFGIVYFAHAHTNSRSRARAVVIPIKIFLFLRSSMSWFD